MTYSSHVRSVAYVAILGCLCADQTRLDVWMLSELGANCQESFIDSIEKIFSLRILLQFKTLFRILQAGCHRGPSRSNRNISRGLTTYRSQNTYSEPGIIYSYLIYDLMVIVYFGILLRRIFIEIFWTSIYTSHCKIYRSRSTDHCWRSVSMKTVVTMKKRHSFSEDRCISPIIAIQRKKNFAHGWYDGTQLCYLIRTWIDSEKHRWNKQPL